MASILEYALSRKLRRSFVRLSARGSRSHLTRRRSYASAAVPRRGAARLRSAWRGVALRGVVWRGAARRSAAAAPGLVVSRSEIITRT